jgi:hypothetical protein
MYRNTTPWQVGRAVGVWMFGIGVFLLPFIVNQLIDLSWPGATAAATVLLVGGGLTYFGSLAALRRADAANRPVLMSPDGHLVLKGREDFEGFVVRVRGWVLAAFVVVGVLFLFTLSQHSCGTRDDGMCGWPRLSVETMATLQITGIVLGSLYVALTVLRVVHARESERLGALITEGRKQRRAEDPFAGTRREGWEFD